MIEKLSQKKIRWYLLKTYQSNTPVEDYIAVEPS